MSILDFKTKEDFRKWLIANHASSEGRDIFIYKKKFHEKGLNYEDAVQTALCYGWIDAVTHSYNEEKYIQYFAQRKKQSNWSLSNIKRMDALIKNNEMTDAGLKYFKLELLAEIETLEAKAKAEKEGHLSIPDYFLDILEKSDALMQFNNETNSTKRRYIAYIKDAKQEKTKIRRCHKIVDILNGGINNL